MSNTPNDRPRSPAVAALFDRFVGDDPSKLAAYEDAKRETADLQRVYDALCEIMTFDAAMAWLETANPAFDGRTPEDLIEAGETARIDAMLVELRRGMAN